MKSKKRFQINLNFNLLSAKKSGKVWTVDVGCMRSQRLQEYLLLPAQSAFYVLDASFIEILSVFLLTLLRIMVLTHAPTLYLMMTFPT